MESIKNLFKIGYGPSSSHTMGPQKAATIFKNKHPHKEKFKVYLYGSLALTGKGHLTDFVIKKTLGENITEVIFMYDTYLDYHPNALKFECYEKEKLIDSWTVYSIGGGEIVDLSTKQEVKNIYPHNSMSEILSYCSSQNIRLIDYILNIEDKSIYDYLDKVIDAMINSVKTGLSISGVLPGPLKVKRRAKDLFLRFLTNNDFDTLLFASCLAASESNASANIIVTAPTCGSCGVLSGAIYTLIYLKKFDREKIKQGLLIAGLIGNLIKTNASISGALVGCQGEIGAASSMASAMICFLNNGNDKQIEYAAEIGLEHHLGMTCDPVLGYVQIPCIERNAISAKRAFDSSKYALLSDGTHYISLDHVIATMKRTGMDLNSKYKETSLGGLAIKE